MRGGSQIPRAEEQHRAKAVFAGAAGQRQPRSLAGHRPVIVEELVLSMAQAALIRIVERPVDVVLTVAARADHRQLGSGDRLEHARFAGEACLDLNLEAFLLDGAANRDQFLQHADLAASQEARRSA